MADTEHEKLVNFISSKISTDNNYEKEFLINSYGNFSDIFDNDVMENYPELYNSGYLFSFCVPIPTEQNKVNGVCFGMGYDFNKADPNKIQDIANDTKEKLRKKGSSIDANSLMETFENKDLFKNHYEVFQGRTLEGIDNFVSDFQHLRVIRRLIGLTDNEGEELIDILLFKVLSDLESKILTNG